MNQFLKLFLIYLLPTLGLLFFGGWFTYSGEVERELRRLQDLERTEVVLGARAVEQNLRFLVSEVAIIANSPLLSRLFSQDTADNRQQLSRYFADIASHRNFYHQIRWLDATGREKVRVDADQGLVRIIPAQELQDKSGRYYFTEANSLDAGQIYFSRFDLNIERGEIEIPLRPMLRVAMPVFDDQQQRQGIAIINYAGIKIINDFAQQFERDKLSHSMLIDGFGYWLLGPDKANEWGFMFGNDKAFSHRFSDEWAEIQRNEAGQFMTDNGLFTYRKLALNNRASLAKPGNVLVALSFVPIEDVDGLAVHAKIKIWGAVFILVILSMVGIYFLSRSIVSGEAYRRELAIQAHQQLLLESMSEGVIGVDPHGDCTFVNHSALNMLGYSRDHMLGKRLHQVVHYKYADGSPYPAEECPVCGSLEHNEVYRGEEFYVTQQGQMLPVDVFFNPVTDSGQIIGGVITFRDISFEMKAKDEIYRLSNFDRITNLPNRRLVITQLTEAVSELLNSGLTSALIVLDIDRFTYINDALGSHSGNFILLSLAERFKRMIRNNDLLGRIGSDEFAIYLDDVDAEQTLAWINRLVEAISQPFDIMGKDLQVSLSVGVCLLPGDANSSAKALQHAQIAMTRAKDDQVRKVQFFDPEMQSYSLRVTQMEQALRKALTNAEFELHFQPQLNRAHELVGAEALIRWRVADGGLVSPAEFIPVAEDTGLIKEIDKWVLEHALRQRQVWLEQFPDQSFTLAVNLSAKQFNSPDLIEFVNNALTEHALDPSLIELEITERSMMGDPSLAKQIMNDLKALGLKLSIDDFGTGYSSLVYLKDLPIDVLKIDQSFVRDMVDSQGSQSIVRAMISMADALNMKTIAEGVEEQVHLDMLEMLQCDIYQGYYFSRPLSQSDFEQWMLSRC